MIFFGHIGITGCIFKTCEKRYKHQLKKNNFEIDYRFVILGSDLPDLIDKPLQAIIDGRIVLEGKLIGHTLIFTLLLITLGYILFKKKKNSKVLIIGIGCLIHTILDLMWAFPNVYFYPMYGIRSILFLHTGTLPLYVFKYLNNYGTFEVLGFWVTILCYHSVMKKNKFIKFIKDGKLGN